MVIFELPGWVFCKMRPLAPSTQHPRYDQPVGSPVAVAAAIEVDDDVLVRLVEVLEEDVEVLEEDVELLLNEDVEVTGRDVAVDEAVPTWYRLILLLPPQNSLELPLQAMLQPLEAAVPPEPMLFPQSVFR